MFQQKGDLSARYFSAFVFLPSFFIFCQRWFNVSLEVCREREWERENFKICFTAIKKKKAIRLTWQALTAKAAGATVKSYKRFMNVVACIYIHTSYATIINLSQQQLPTHTGTYTLTNGVAVANAVALRSVLNQCGKDLWWMRWFCVCMYVCVSVWIAECKWMTRI